ncbi:MAG: DUF1697 domain-containing protein [Mycobacteriaceae bacterium]|nr:DUF1697 domain-containing protein [Mycobacteriaceae bacterium]MBV9638312.1 DUF1697 domain-containing protein [Mycobacteriaceae bacterium]
MTTTAGTTRYAAFLRGVNVGGVNLKMAEVAEALQRAGFTNVRTVLASGNVLLDSRGRPAAVQAKAEAALRDRFGYDAWVLAYDLPAVRAIVDNYPFQPEMPGHHSYVTLVSDATILDELAGLAAEPGRGERIARGDGVIYWQVPRSKTLDSTMGKTMGKKRYRSATTTRNLRTLNKVLR